MANKSKFHSMEAFAAPNEMGTEHDLSLTDKKNYFRVTTTGDTPFLETSHVAVERSTNIDVSKCAQHLKMMNLRVINDCQHKSPYQILMYVNTTL